jgi:hypothetical protein
MVDEMETVKLIFGELSEARRRAAEQLLGRELRFEDELQIVIGSTSEACRPELDSLPEWCDVYKGYSDEEIDRLERIIMDHPFDLGPPSAP